MHHADKGGFASPLEAYQSGTKEKLLYLPAVLNRGFDGAVSDKPDYLATVDVDPTSSTYSTVIHRLPMPIVGDELHHMVSQSGTHILVLQSLCDALL